MKTKKKGYRKGTFSLFLIALPGILYLFINNYVPIRGYIYWPLRGSAMQKGYGTVRGADLIISNFCSLQMTHG